MLLQLLLGRKQSVHPTGTSENMLKTSIFVIGFYLGWEKPDVGSSFLLELDLELCRLSPTNCDIVCFNGRIFTASLRCILADVLTRAYLKRTKSHSGYKGYIGYAIVVFKSETWLIENLAYPIEHLNTHKRTISVILTYLPVFCRRQLKDQTDLSPFFENEFPIVSGFVIDPIHTEV